MAQRYTKQRHYLIQEPTSGLYANIAGDRPRLTGEAEASKFASVEAAATAASASRLNEQPHELVRVDE